MNRGDFFDYKHFGDINLTDPFFDSLKEDYKEFEEWFRRKSNEMAYVYEDDAGIQAFLYLKLENESLNDINPPLSKKRRVKIGTLKINPHGTRFGERFIKKAIDFTVENNVKELYVTVFKKHHSLVTLFKRYGFYNHGTKTTKNGTELVLIKSLHKNKILQMNKVRHHYPLINKMNNAYLLSIYPKYHSRLFPDSILNTEKRYDVVKDKSFTNSIEKIYICRMKDVIQMKPNDNIVIYRTKEEGKIAEYSAVASSICTVVEVKTRNDFNNIDELISYCRDYSIFTEEEIRAEYFRNSPMIIIKMLYNTALNRRIIRKKLIEECGIDREQYWGIIKLKGHQFSKILELGEVNESIIIN